MSSTGAGRNGRACSNVGPIRRELELVVMSGQDARARGCQTPSRPGVGAPSIRTVRDHPRGPHAVWRWVPVEESGG
jgi:hypothetical protein